MKRKSTSSPSPDLKAEGKQSNDDLFAIGLENAGTAGKFLAGAKRKWGWKGLILSCLGVVVGLGLAFISLYMGILNERVVFMILHKDHLTYIVENYDWARQKPDKDASQSTTPSAMQKPESLVLRNWDSAPEWSDRIETYLAREVETVSKTAAGHAKYAVGKIGHHITQRSASFIWQLSTHDPFELDAWAFVIAKDTEPRLLQRQDRGRGTILQFNVPPTNEGNEIVAVVIVKWRGPPEVVEDIKKVLSSSTL